MAASGAGLPGVLEAAVSDGRWAVFAIAIVVAMGIVMLSIIMAVHCAPDDRSLTIGGMLFAGCSR